MADMNLSSSSSEEEYSSNDEDLQQKFKYQSDNGDHNENVSVAHKRNDDALSSSSEDDDNEFDDIDWEDGSNEHEDLEIHGNTSGSINLTNKSLHFKNIRDETENKYNHHQQNQQNQSHKKNKKRRKKRGQFKKIQISSTQVKSMLQNIQRTHLLALTSRSIFHSSFFMGGDRSESDCITTNSPNKSTISRYCTNNDVNHDDHGIILNVAHSLIPMQFWNDLNEQLLQPNSMTVTPNMILFDKFCTWFFQFVNQNKENRRRGRGGSRKRNNDAIQNATRRTKRFKKNSKGDESDSGKESKKQQKLEQSKTPLHDVNQIIAKQNQKRFLQLLEYLSIINNEDSNTLDETLTTIAPITPLEKTLILMCMMRSMGWRVRFVNSIDPVSQELTVDHPLFSLGMKNAFQSIMNSASKSKSKKDSQKKSHQGTSKKMTIAATTTGKTKSTISQLESTQPFIEFPWVEVLVRKNNNLRESASRTKSKSRWIHVDPHFELVDKPLLVELIRGQKHDIKKIASLKKNGTAIPVSFVIAVEHTIDDNKIASTSHTLNHENYNTALLTTRITDVSPRYSNKWSKTLRLRGATAKELEKSGGNCSNIWWSKTIKKANKYFNRKKNSPSSSTATKSCGEVSKFSSLKIEKRKSGEEVLVIDDSSGNDTNLIKENLCNENNDADDYDEEADSAEAEELMSSKKNEAIPTSKTAFKNHPLYVIPSVLKSQEVLAPDAKKRICGMFKGELVYKRSDVSTALNSKKWLYNSRKVRESELKNPVKKMKARKKPIKKGFQALKSYGGEADETQASILASSIAEGAFETKDDMVSLYGMWQTDPWSPPYIGPDDEIIVNEHKNVELALINPGLVHLELHRISKVAKQLGIPYAPCLLGFEGHGGNRTPTIRGIVVHEHNADLLQEAHAEFESQVVEDAYKKKQEEIIRRWKRLVRGVLTADRLKREYEKA